MCLAEGEGRNASFLASSGFRVTAVDQSKQGLQKTKELVRAIGVDITAIEANLEYFRIAPSYWEAIVPISAHLPLSIRKAFIIMSLVGLNLVVIEFRSR